MTETTSQNSRTAAFRAAIAHFINERFEAKRKGADDATAASLAARYEYSAWLADAARRVGQIQAVTHVLKATHPDARGSSFHVTPERLPQHLEIGTHSLGEHYADDIVGNAAALDVYKFLKVEVKNRRLLDWFLQDDTDLLSALHDNKATAQEWAAAFKGLVRPSSAALASHEKAKQVYWCCSGEPTDDAGFHLLQPLFSSTLAHAVHAEISEARFGEANAKARHAKWNKQPHDGIYQNYHNLVANKLGGTKPQNISQLNSERGGINYLLASLPPPPWGQERPVSFLGIDSVFSHFLRSKDAYLLIQALRQLLKSNPDPTMETRIKRERIEQELGKALAAFGLEVRYRLHAGWTRNEDCKLHLSEQLWLDPERAELPPRADHEAEDIAFTQAFEWKDWPDEVATRFARELNDILHKAKLPVGDTELKHWAKQAIVDADWPATMQRRAVLSQSAEEQTHG
ncbi:type I-F CRISPR-associated protein Csy1 [Betaproteobacteria bacterium]|nr:type I-F CRISPR-associated protein Csy1 [Betaproteobacteria bacterium]